MGNLHSTLKVTAESTEKSGLKCNGNLLGYILISFRWKNYNNNKKEKEKE